MFGENFYNTSLGLTEKFLADQINPNDSIIDVGCGSGRWARIADKYSKHVIGVDYQTRSIDIARSYDSNVEFVVADINVDLSHYGYFDLALVIHVLEHIDNPLILLNELRRCAKKIIIEVPDLESDALNYARVKMQLPYYSDANHVREYTKTLIVSDLERSGWEIQEVFKNSGAIVVVAT
jgi:SAM-dependent methyltransferase